MYVGETMFFLWKDMLLGEMMSLHEKVYLKIPQKQVYLKINKNTIIFKLTCYKIQPR